MPLYRRLPKRGFTPPFRKDFRLIALSRIAAAFKDGDTVDPTALVKAGLAGRKDALIKVLCDADKFERKVVLNVHAVSTPVRELVEKAGGEIRLITAVPEGKKPVKPVPNKKNAKNAKKS
jgi:large subunit ribosomal protein L15